MIEGLVWPLAVAYVGTCLTAAAALWSGGRRRAREEAALLEKTAAHLAALAVQHDKVEARVQRLEALRMGGER